MIHKVLPLSQLAIIGSNFTVLAVVVFHNHHHVLEDDTPHLLLDGPVPVEDLFSAKARLKSDALEMQNPGVHND